MDTHAVANINIETPEILITPAELKRSLPLSDRARDTISKGRSDIENILQRKDHRIVVVVGPCSIHDFKAAHEHDARLNVLAEKVSDTLLVVMRVYFEKPRTTAGWKGLINDPFMNDSFKITDGLHIGRQLLHDILEVGLPTATEALDPISPQYMQDLIAWSAIGARTTESQTHREMASGLSSSVGFKNGTDGNLNMAVNAIRACSSPQSCLGINDKGQISTFKARGNISSHIILRGGTKPNYDNESVLKCEKLLKENGLAERIMIDCSHDNSNQDYRNQGKVIEDIKSQILSGNKSIFGVMLESNLFSGKQKILSDKESMKYGVSVTDGCIDWNETVSVIRSLKEAI